MDMVQRVAPMDSPVLLLGETGSGKEVIANAIHCSSGRREGPFIKVNCGAIPETLVDSELFGHEKGAFTGAVSQKRGRFERANKGTLFLDEIGELRPSIQVKLLRVLQNHEIERVGGSKAIPADIRIIAATHRDLEQMVSEGGFREDLLYRINVFPIHIPPLRDRKMDIPALVQHIVESKSRMMALSEVPTLAPGAIDVLTAYDWPGNVRELENVVERALILRKGGKLDFRELGGHRRSSQSKTQEFMEADFPLLDEAISSHILRALKLTGGRIEGRNGAARVLGVNPSTLRNRMKKLGIRFSSGPCAVRR
jgi:transcriptional regulator with GAF, ATPase, and Fis domain